LNTNQENNGVNEKGTDLTASIKKLMLFLAPLFLIVLIIIQVVVICCEFTKYLCVILHKFTTDFVFLRFHRQSQFGENGNRRFRGKLLVVAVLTRNRWRVKTSTVFISLPRSIQEAQHPMAKNTTLLLENPGS